MGFDMDLVLFWVLPEGSPLANLLWAETPEKRWKQTCIHVPTLFLLNHWLTFWQTPLGFWWLWNPECSNISFFLPESGSDQECLLETDTDRRLSVQTIGESERDRGWNGVVPPFLPTELCLKFVVLLRKVAVKLDSSHWTLSYLKCDDIRESCLLVCHVIGGGRL